MLKHFLILGYGVTGKSILKYLVHKYSVTGLNVTLFDQQADFANDPFIQHITHSLKQFTLNFIKDLKDIIQIHQKTPIDYAVASPGIKPASYQPVIVDQLHIPLFSDIKLFIDELNNRESHAGTQADQSNIYAITGTNGKSTVSALLHCLLAKAKFSTALGGNFGLAVTDLLIEGFEAKSHSKPDTKPQPAIINHYSDYVLELSSYQLELTDHLPCLAAVCLNLSPNHLDWHHGFENYIHAKLKVYANSKVDVINLDDAIVLEQYKTMILPEKVNNGQLPKIILYSIAGLTSQHQDDIFYQQQILELKLQAPNLSFLIFDIKTLPSGEQYVALNGTNLLNIADLPPVLTTKHNISNLLAVLGLLSARCANNKSEELLSYIKKYVPFLPEFVGLPFRCQKISDQHNIHVFNDSKSTNLTATIKAVESVTALTQGKIILIMGGILKEDIDDPQSRQEFIKCLNDNAKKMPIVIILSHDPSSQEKLLNIIKEANEFNSSSISTLVCTDLAEVMMTSYAHAKSTDSILFSPAGASFDLFKNYIDRGEKFTKACEEYLGVGNNSSELLR